MLDLMAIWLTSDDHIPSFTIGLVNGQRSMFVGAQVVDEVITIEGEPVVEGDLKAGLHLKWREMICGKSEENL